MIPKKIHYCWFGGNKMPKSAVKCIKSWKKFFPDYEIIEWNEDNYDVKKNQYIWEAYKMKKYAFVSDFARFDILYHEGGLYFDTDVEVIKNFDKIIQEGGFMGCEVDGSNEKQVPHGILVNPGLGLAAKPKLDLYKEIIEYYNQQKFLKPDGSMNMETVVTRTTDILMRHGLNDIKGIQKVAGITIYPADFFNPRNNNTGALQKTENTHAIHWYSQSWVTTTDRLRSKLTRPFHRVFGEECFEWLKKNK